MNTGKPSRDQRGDEQALVALNHDIDPTRVAVIAVLGEQLEQLAEPGSAVTDAGAGDDPSIPVDDSDIVVPLGPIDTARLGHSPTPH